MDDYTPGQMSPYSDFIQVTVGINDIQFLPATLAEKVHRYFNETIRQPGVAHQVKVTLDRHDYHHFMQRRNAFRGIMSNWMDPVINDSKDYPKKSIEPELEMVISVKVQKEVKLNLNLIEL